MADQALIEEASRRLAAAVAPGRHQGDLDSLIVDPSVTHAGEESVSPRRALRGLGMAADGFVVSAHDTKEWRDVRRRPVHAAVSEGCELVA